jgi:hypothetical protein
VCSPDVLEVHCQTPAEMMLASLLCGYAESAESAEIVSAPDRPLAEV